MTGEIESIRKAPQFKVGNRFKIIKYKNIFSKGYTNNWSKKHLWLILCERLILGLTKIEDLNEETIIKSFYQKELLLNELQMSYYPEPENNIRESSIRLVKLCY